MIGNVISIQNERDLVFLIDIFFQSQIEWNTISFADFSTEPESVLSIGITSHLGMLVLANAAISPPHPQVTS